MVDRLKEPPATGLRAEVARLTRLVNRQDRAIRRLTDQVEDIAAWNEVSDRVIHVIATKIGELRVADAAQAETIRILLEAATTVTDRVMLLQRVGVEMAHQTGQGLLFDVIVEGIKEAPGT